MTASVTSQSTEKNVEGFRWCTYRVGGPIDNLFQPASVDEAVLGLQNAYQSGQSITVLGSGSNTLISTLGLRGLTFVSKNLLETEVLDNNCVRLGAGVSLAKAAKFFQQHALSGAEFMIGVPGTIGGAVAMNAGAMKQETADTLISATIYDLKNNRVEVWDKTRLDFSYRHSTIQDANSTLIVLDATFQLLSGNANEIQQKMLENMNWRQMHHPKEPNGGSVFRNPENNSAGKLLDALGARGNIDNNTPAWKEGGASVSPMHANFIINTGSAISLDVLKLMLRMKRAVLDNYQITLCPENKFMGEATTEEQTIWKELTQDVN